MTRQNAALWPAEIPPTTTFANEFQRLVQAAFRHLHSDLHVEAKMLRHGEDVLRAHQLAQRFARPFLHRVRRLGAHRRAHLADDDLRAAATALVTGLGPQILGYLAASLRDHDAAYEVFGQFCEELWKSLPRFRGDSSMKTWAYKIVLHVVSRYRRDGFRRRATPVADDQLAQLAADVRSRTPRYQRTEVKDRFAELRGRLDDDEQTLLFLRVDQGLSWADVAAVVAEAEGPVEVASLRKRFERAKQRLRKLAVEHGLIED